MPVKNLAWPLPAGVSLTVWAWLLSLDQRSAKSKLSCHISRLLEATA